METSPLKPAPDAEIERQIRYDQPWLVSFLRPVLIVVLVTCLNIALIALLQRLLLAAPPVFFQTLLLLGILAAVIGVTTTTWLAQPSQRLRRNAIYRTAEIVCLLVVARLLLWLTMMRLPAFADFILHPVTTVMDGYFLTTLAVITVAWTMAAMFSDDLLALAIQPDEIYRAEATTRAARDTSRGGDSGRQLFLNSFVGRWVFGGVLLVIIASGTQIDYANRGFFALLRQSIDPAVITAVVVYFFAGLLLISQGQLALLRARWTIERIPSSETVLRNWPGYVLALLITVGILAAILPFGGTHYLSLIIGAIISGIYMVLFVVVNLIMVFILLLLSLLPFSEPSEEPLREQMAEAMIPPQAPQPAYLAWLGGSMFWVIAALLVGYAAFVYFSGKGIRFQQLAWLWTMLKMRWRQLFGAVHDWRRARRVGKARSTSEEAGIGGWRSWFDRFGRRQLNPEQRIRYYYLTMLEQAERAGAARRSAETPGQYAPRLTATLVDEAEDLQRLGGEARVGPESEPVDIAIERLTDEFVRVRYAGQTVNDEDLSLLEALWSRLRTALRRYGDV